MLRFGEKIACRNSISGSINLIKRNLLVEFISSIGEEYFVQIGSEINIFDPNLNSISLSRIGSNRFKFTAELILPTNPFLITSPFHDSEKDNPIYIKFYIPMILLNSFGEELLKKVGLSKNITMVNKSKFGMCQLELGFRNTESETGYYDFNPLPLSIIDAFLDENDCITFANGSRELLNSQHTNYPRRLFCKYINISAYIEFDVTDASLLSEKKLKVISNVFSPSFKYFKRKEGRKYA